MLYHYTSKSNFYNYIYATDLIRAKTLLDMMNSDNPDNRDLTYPISWLFKHIKLLEKTSDEDFNSFVEWCKTYNLSKETYTLITNKLKSLSVLCVSKNPSSDILKESLVSEKEGVIIGIDETKLKKCLPIFPPKIYEVEYLEYDSTFKCFVDDFPIDRIMLIYSDIHSNYKINQDFFKNSQEYYEIELILLLTYLVSLAKPKDKSDEKEVRIIIDLERIRETKTEAFRNYDKNDIGQVQENSFYLSIMDKRRFDFVYKRGFEKALENSLFNDKKFEKRIKQIITLNEFKYDYSKMSLEEKIIVFYRYCLKFIVNGKDLKCVYIRLSSIIPNDGFTFFIK